MLDLGEAIAVCSLGVMQGVFVHRCTQNGLEVEISLNGTKLRAEKRLDSGSPDDDGEEED